MFRCPKCKAILDDFHCLRCGFNVPLLQYAILYLHHNIRLVLRDVHCLLQVHPRRVYLVNDKATVTLFHNFKTVYADVNGYLTALVDRSRLPEFILKMLYAA